VPACTGKRGFGTLSVEDHLHAGLLLYHPHSGPRLSRPASRIPSGRHLAALDPSPCPTHSRLLAWQRVSGDRVDAPSPDNPVARGTPPSFFHRNMSPPSGVLNPSPSGLSPPSLPVSWRNLLYPREHSNCPSASQSMARHGTAPSYCPGGRTRRRRLDHARERERRERPPSHRSL
jgi:hypothetical protein